MYSFDGRVRYSETDSEEYITIESVIDYFQDAAIFHTLDLGEDVEGLKKKKSAWMTCSWQLEIVRYPKHGEEITVCTWPYGFKAFIGERNCLMKTKDGETLVKANSLWSFMDMEAGRPKKVPDDVIAMYGVEDPLDMEYKPRKIPVPKEGGQVLPELVVERHHLDSLGHVNNGQYVKMALDYRRTVGRVKNFRAEYKMQAHLGDVIIPIRYEEEDREIIVLGAQDGSAYATVEITKQDA